MHGWRGQPPMATSAPPGQCWWPRARFRRCAALALRPAALSRSSITATPRGSVTSGGRPTHDTHSQMSAESENTVRTAPLGETVRSTALPRFLLLYAAMYAAFGVASPFLPALVNVRGVPAAQLGLVLSAGTAIRLLTAPLAGRLGDLIQGLRLVLVGCLGLAAVVTLGYGPAQGFWPFLALSLGHAAALALVTILADALALGAAMPPQGKSCDVI